MSTPVNDRRLPVRPVFRDQVVVIASPDHPLAKRRRVALTDLFFVISCLRDEQALQSR